MPFTTEQPHRTFDMMSLTAPLANKSPQASQCEHSHKSCHVARVRRFIIPALFFLLTVAAFFVLEAVDLGTDAGVGGVGGGLLRRAGEQGAGSTNDAPFVRNKLYLIVVIVGLFLCLIAAIMLAACCCRSSFKNPLCCPCYLCACCGGLACLECISCGLCAEGISDLNV